MGSIPDRSGANLDLLANAALNGSPSFPYPYSHTNGYFATSDFTDGSVDIIFTVPRRIDTSVEADARIILAVHDDGVDDPTILCLGGMHNFASGLSTAPTSSTTWTAVFEANVPYYLHLSADAGNIAVWAGNPVQASQDGAQIDTGLGVEGMHTNSAVYYFGFPKDEWLAANRPGDAGAAFSVLEGMVIKVLADNPGNEGPADVDPVLSPYIVPFTSRIATQGGFVGRLAAGAPHLTPALSPRTFFSGDDTYFTVKGSEVWAKAGVADNTVYTFTVNVADQFTWSVDKDVLIGVGAGAGISALVIDNDTITAPTQVVGTLSVTDTNTNNVVTYSLVSGTGDTNNDLFEINTDSLDFIAASSAGTYYCRVRATDFWGKYTETAFTITVGA